MTLPVNDTKLTRGCWMTKVARDGDKCKTWKTSSGSPARSRARAKRSAVRGVCGDGFNSTELPAMIAGKTELIDVRYG